MRKVISFDKELEFKTMIGEITSISLDQDLSFQDDSTVSGELVVSGKYKLTAASRLEDDFLFHLPMEIVLTERLDSKTRNVTIEDFRYEVEDNDILLCHIDLLVEGVEIIDDIESDSSDSDIRETTGSSASEIVDSSHDTGIKSELSEEELRPVEATDIVTPIESTFSTPVVSSQREEPFMDVAPVISSNVSDKSIDVDVDISVNNNVTDTADTNTNVNTNTNTNTNINSSAIANSSSNASSTAIIETADTKDLKDQDESDGVGSLFSSFKDSDETFATYSVYIFRANDTIEMIMDKYQVTKEELESYNDLSSLTIGSKVIIPTHIHE